MNPSLILTTVTSMLNGFDGASLTVLDALIKATLTFSIAGLATFALARASAALRHLIWALALASALMLPLLSIALPKWQLPVIQLAAEQPAERATVHVEPTAPTTQSATPNIGTASRERTTAAP